MLEKGPYQRGLLHREGFIRMLQLGGSGSCWRGGAIGGRDVALFFVEVDGHGEAVPESWVSNAGHVAPRGEPRNVRG